VLMNKPLSSEQSALMTNPLSSEQSALTTDPLSSEHSALMTNPLSSEPSLLPESDLDCLVEGVPLLTLPALSESRHVPGLHVAAVPVPSARDAQGLYNLLLNAHHGINSGYRTLLVAVKVKVYDPEATEELRWQWAMASCTLCSYICNGSLCKHCGSESSTSRPKRPQNF
jgi:hypothetical protein